MQAAELPGPDSAPEGIDGDWPTLAELERRYIERALDYSSGNQRNAAKLLGIDKSTLWRKLQTFQRARVQLEHNR
jgi:DNA-binding NtrC family response regulator